MTQKIISASFFGLVGMLKKNVFAFKWVSE